MNSPKNSPGRSVNYFADLYKRRNEGEKLSIAEESYCWAIQNGYGHYVADLMYMEGDGQVLSSAEQAYLEAKLEGVDDVGAEAKASQTESEFPGFEQDSWDEVVRSVRDGFFRREDHEL